MTLLIHPMAPLVALTLWEALIFCYLVATGGRDGGGLTAILGVGWAWILACWADADPRKLRAVPCFDFGFLMGIGLPVSLLWYCLWSRGWRGLLLLLLFIGLWLAPFIIAVIFGTIRAIVL